MWCGIIQVSCAAARFALVRRGWLQVGAWLGVDACLLARRDRTGMLSRKKTYDLKHDVRLRFEIGNRVLRLAGTKKDAKAVHPKGTNFWLGPCNVEKVLPFDDYTVRDIRTGRVYPKVHVSRLRWAPKVDDEHRPLLDLCPVAALVDRRLRTIGGEHFVWYKIRWSKLTSLADEWRRREHLVEIAEMVAAYEALNPLPEYVVADYEQVSPVTTFETPAVAPDAARRARFKAHPPNSRPRQEKETVPVPEAPAPEPEVEQRPAAKPTATELTELQNSWLSVGSRVQVYYPHEREWHAATVESNRLAIPRKAGRHHRLEVEVRWDAPLPGEQPLRVLEYGDPHPMQPMRTRQPVVVKVSEAEHEALVSAAENEALGSTIV